MLVPCWEPQQEGATSTQFFLQPRQPPPTRQLGWGGVKQGPLHPQRPGHTLGLPEVLVSCSSFPVLGEVGVGQPCRRAPPTGHR